LVETKALCEEFSCEFNIVFIPNSTFFKPDSRADSYGDMIKSWSEANAVPFFDTRDILNRNKQSPDYAIMGPHLSPVGYAKLAEFLS